MYKGTSGQLQIADRPNRVKIALDLPAGNKDSRIAAAGGIDPISILTGNGPAVNVDPEKAGADTRVADKDAGACVAYFAAVHVEYRSVVFLVACVVV